MLGVGQASGRRLRLRRSLALVRDRLLPIPALRPTLPTTSGSAPRP